MKTSITKNQESEIKLLWMYPDLMNTYGDRGNILVLEERIKRRGYSVSTIRHSLGGPVSDIETADLIFMGGAQDRQQEIVAKDLIGKKGKALKKKIEHNIPGLYICGAYQFLGNFYKAADGTKILGLSVFDLHTEHPGDQKKRLIGNCIIEWNGHKLIGFENHGGRTYLASGTKPFATVVKGSGNNGEDALEGVLYKNSIGSYLHGPILPKNPVLADWLIHKAFENKYKQTTIELDPLEDPYSNRARNVVLNKLS